MPLPTKPEISTKNPAISVVLLAHNEADIIEYVIYDFHQKIVAKNPNSELIIVEDGSTDGTKEILSRLSREHQQIRNISEPQKLGYVNAFKKAMSYPKNEIVAFCDSSGKYEPNDLLPMIHLIKDYDLILGYKINRKDPLYRIILTKIFSLIVNLYFNVSYKDIDCPLRLFRKEAFEYISKEPWFEKFLINFELTLRFHYRGYRVTQIPISHKSRKNGPSRGLPLQKIPLVILNVLKNFPRTKKAILDPQFRRVI